MFKTATQAQRGPYMICPSTSIGRLRLLAGLTKKDAAKRCGISLRTYERAEAGDVVAFETKRLIERRLGGW